MAQSRSLEREVFGITGLASVWSTSGPSEPVASLTQPLRKNDCCLGLTCEMAFYRPARQRGVRKN